MNKILKSIASFVLPCVLGAFSAEAVLQGDEFELEKQQRKAVLPTYERDALVKGWNASEFHFRGMASTPYSPFLATEAQARIADGYVRLLMLKRDDIEGQATWLAAIHFAKRGIVSHLYKLLDQKEGALVSSASTPIQPTTASEPDGQLKGGISTPLPGPAQAAPSGFSKAKALAFLGLPEGGFDSESLIWKRHRTMLVSFRCSPMEMKAKESLGWSEDIEGFLRGKITGPDFRSEDKPYMAHTFKIMAGHYRAFEQTGNNLDEIVFFKFLLRYLDGDERNCRRNFLIGLGMLNPLPSDIVLEEERAPSALSVSYPYFLEGSVFKSKSRYVRSERGYDIVEGPLSGRVNGCGLQSLGINVKQFIEWFDQHNTTETRHAFRGFIEEGLLGSSHLQDFCKAKGYILEEIQQELYQGEKRSWARRDRAGRLFQEGHSRMVEFFRYYMLQSPHMLLPSEVRLFASAMGKRVRIHMFSIEQTPPGYTPDIEVLMTPGHFQRVFPQ